jgi:phage FluMu protein Com
MVDIVKCNKCGGVINEASDVALAKRIPCPSCGSTSRLFEKSLIIKVGIVTSNKMKGKHANEKKPFIEEFSGKDLFRKTGQLMDKIRVIDRGNDLYQEIVTEPRTGIVIRSCIEPLSKHTEHGSAKKP